MTHPDDLWTGIVWGSKNRQKELNPGSSEVRVAMTLQLFDYNRLQRQREQFMQTIIRFPVSTARDVLWKFGQPAGLWTSSCLLTQGHLLTADSEQTH